MEITKENLKDLRKSEFAHFMASLMGVNLNKLIDDYEKELIEKEKPKETPKVERKQLSAEDLHKILDEMVRDGELKTTTKDGETAYYVDDTCKKPYEAPKCEVKSETPTFKMSKEQFVHFCKTYKELIDAERKLSYLFGVEFNEGGSGFGFSSKAREVIWNFVRIIFGDDNAEDIADFLYENSNFDNAESLYDELF